MLFLHIRETEAQRGYITCSRSQSGKDKIQPLSFLTSNPRELLCLSHE